MRSRPVAGAAFLRYTYTMIKIKKIFAIIVLPLTLVMCNTTPEPKPVEIKFEVDLSSLNFPAGEIKTQIRRTFPLTGIRMIDVMVYYFPYDDAVCLQYRSDFFTHHQFWSRSGRDAFFKALEKYNEDYSARNLDEKNRTSTKQYGVVEGYLYWQMYAITRRVSANMDVELGYAFNDQSPYFAITQNQTTYVDEVSEENDLDSQKITMYFTRAQAQELAKLFNQDYLRTLVPPELGGLRRVVDTDIEVDEY